MTNSKRSRIIQTAHITVIPDIQAFAAMISTPVRTVCWSPIWNKHCKNIGLAHLVLTTGAATGVILAVDEDDVPFRLDCHLCWTQSGCLQGANLILRKGLERRSMNLHADGLAHWKHANGQLIPELDGCIDIDIWPTPFTNSFPLWRTPMNIGQRKVFRVVWINGCEMTFKATSQAYSRLGERLYLFESLDGSQFQAELSLDKHGLVINYPELFQRIDVQAKPG